MRNKLIVWTCLLKKKEEMLVWSLDDDNDDKGKWER